MHAPPQPRAQCGHDTLGNAQAIHRFASQNLRSSSQLEAEQGVTATREIPSTFQSCVTTLPAAQPATPSGYHRCVGPQLPQISFEIVAECPHTRARAGLL